MELQRNRMYKMAVCTNSKPNYIISGNAHSIRSTLVQVSPWVFAIWDKHSNTKDLAEILDGKQSIFDKHSINIRR